MAELFWFGATVRFLCKSCKRTSAENMALSSDRQDPTSINRVINSQKLICQLCGEPPLDGTSIDVHVELGTPERLRALGYPVPPHAGK
jgi:hypothetical protein